MKYLKILSLVLVVALQSCLSADDDPVAVAPMTGSEVNASVGGPTQPNQLWIDLSDYENPVVNKRTDWDLGFYNGDEYRVIINGSIAMAVAKIPNATNIDNVKQTDVNNLLGIVQMGTFDPANMQYIDNPDGNFLTQTTGIQEIKENDAENPIYLVNMGRALPADGATVAPGSILLAGDTRGWKKVQIVRAPNGYKIKYADLNDTSHKEYIITKNTDYTFNFFSMQNNQQVTIQPTRKKWDLCFTSFTNEVFQNGASAGSYFYADFIVTNMANGVGAYQVTVSSNLDQAYNAFKLNDVDPAKFIFNDHRAIGDKWRTTTGNNSTSSAFVYTDRFFILRDAEGFYFKLRFNRMKNDAGERGYTNFEFEPL